jgi:glycosyltransferase involved in cell wall biosynthesis
MKDLSIIVPSWNEGERIYYSLRELGNVLGLLSSTCTSIDLDYEIIVVDDGSEDNTHAQAMKAASENSKIVVVRKENGGKGSALKCGYELCSGDLVVFLDADSDLHPRQIPLFVEYMKKHNADVVVGSKRHPLSKLKYPLRRRIMSRVYQAAVEFLFGLDLRDTQAGLKIFKSKVLKEILPKALSKKFAFDLELLVSANLRGFKLVEAPVELNWQRINSRIGPTDILGIAWDTAAIFYRLKVLKHYDEREK